MNQTNQTNEINQKKLWVLNDEGGRVGARKIGERAADGAAVGQGYWGAEQESEGIFSEKREEEKGLAQVGLSSSGASC